MFAWLKKLVSAGEAAPPPAAEPAAEPAATRPELSVEQVVDRFLVANPTRTPWSVHALIAAGATRLSDAKQVLAACDKIAEHGYQYPLNPTLQQELPQGRLLEFLRWQERAEIDTEAYLNDMRIRALIERFREEAG